MSIDERLAVSPREVVTDIEHDHWGRAWGKIGGVRVWLTYAIDANGTWLDTDGNYHFNAKAKGVA